MVRDILVRPHGVSSLLFLSSFGQISYRSILPEAPILKVSRVTSDVHTVENSVVEQLKTFSRDQQRAFFALHNAHKPPHGTFLGITRTNVLPLGCEAREGGLLSRLPIGRKSARAKRPGRSREEENRRVQDSQAR